MTHRQASAARLLSALALCSVVACVGSVEEDEAPSDVDHELVGTCEPGAVRACDQDEDPSVPGFQFCVESDLGTSWSECEPDYLDEPGSSSIASTPLVLSFDGSAVSYSSAMTGSFDLSRDGVCRVTDWPTARTPWLVLDRNGNGAVDDGGELFGSATRLSGGRFAAHGFQPLAELDGNGDGVLDASDPSWKELRLWFDRDGSRESAPAELASLEAHGLVAIELAYRVDPRCDVRGNCERERSRFWYRASDGSTRAGSVIDVHLAWQ